MAQEEGLLAQSKHKFEIDVGDSGTEEFARMAKGFSSFEPSNNEETDQTQYLDGGGFATTTVMGAQMTLSFEGHRYFGDKAQDYIFSKALAIGKDRETKFRWTKPDGDVLEGTATIATVEGPSGDANAKGEITVEIHFNGKPEQNPTESGSGDGGA